MAITHFGSASNPTDNGTGEEPGTLDVTPPGSMTNGQLVILVGQLRSGSTPGITIGNTGGQTWNDISEVSTSGAQTTHTWWCTYNGTWSANPSLTFPSVSGTAAATVIMHVFDQSTSGRVWGVNVAFTKTNFSAATTITVTGQTTTVDDTVTLAAWAVQDDISWDTLSGSGWATTGSAQYRNTSGNDQSITFAHKIQTAQGATGNVSKNQVTSSSNGMSWIVTFGSTPDGRSGTGTITVVPTVAATGTLEIQGSASVTLAPLVSGTGTTERLGTSAITLVAPTITSTGTVEIQGTSSVILELLVSGSGTVESAAGISGTGTVVLAPSLSGSGTIEIQGTSTLILEPTVTGTGTIDIQGTSAITLSSPSVTSTGTLEIQGTSTITLSAPDVSGTGTVQSPGLTGSAAIVLVPSLSATGTLEIQGTSAVVLVPTITGTGTVAIQGTSTISVSVPTVTSTGTVEIRGTSAITLAPTVTATGTVDQNIEAEGTITLVPSLSATGTLEIRGTGAGTLSAPTLTSTGILAVTGSSAITLVPTVVATAQLEIKGTSTITLSAPTTASTGTLAVSGTSTIALSPTVTGTGILERLGTASITLTLLVTTEGDVSVPSNGPSATISQSSGLVQVDWVSAGFPVEVEWRVNNSVHVIRRLPGDRTSDYLAPPSPGDKVQARVRYYDPERHPRILDLMTARPSAAYALWKLSDDYEGYCIRVKRLSDDDEHDIGFDSDGELNIDSLLGFIGDADARVTVWYDQGLNGFDLNEDALTSTGPDIAIDGVEITDTDGYVSLSFWETSVSALKLGCSGVAKTALMEDDKLTWAVRGKFTGDTNHGVFVGWDGTNTSYLNNDASDFNFVYDGTNVANSGEQSGLNTMIARYAKPNALLESNGSLVDTDTSRTESILEVEDGVLLLGTNNAGTHLKGKIRAVVLYPGLVTGKDLDILRTLETDV